VAGHEPDVQVDRVDVPGARDVAGDLNSFGGPLAILNTRHRPDTGQDNAGVGPNRGPAAIVDVDIEPLAFNIS
jgi:hypothetical protein